jgi:hypothetical protein
LCPPCGESAIVSNEPGGSVLGKLTHDARTVRRLSHRWSFDDDLLVIALYDGTER